MTAVYAVLVVMLLYWIPVRLWFLRWGISDAEAAGSAPGDLLVPVPDYMALAGVTIEARPEHIWPWLLQLGNGRGGLYSYDWLDRLFGYLDAPSADVILPQFQHLAPGDVIPVGGSPGGFPVALIVPERALVLAGSRGPFAWSWELDLEPLDRHRTRLISRSRARVPRGWRYFLQMLVLEPAAFVMTRRMLLGVRARAERLARTPAAAMAGLPQPGA